MIPTALIYWVLMSPTSTVAFSPASLSSSAQHQQSHLSPSSTRLLASSSGSKTDEFASFAASLEEDNDSTGKRSSSSPPNGGSTGTIAKTKKNKGRTWKEDLEDLLDPSTPMAKRQTLLADLLSANQDIRQAVQTALREQKIDPLLTPRAKRVQEGTRAVARQISVDIIPTTTRNGKVSSRGSSNNGGSGGTSSSSSFPLPPLPGMDLLVPPPNDLDKIGRRMFNALQTRVQSDLSELQDDLADPTNRIPQRLSQQRNSFWQGATNVFAETPVGLSEPPYTICSTSSSDYEIRDYEAYTVASTNVLPPVGVKDEDESYEAVVDNPARTAAAFNTLAAYYLLGANKRQEPIATTLPVVTTTMLGEMRFYMEDEIIDKKFGGRIPEPLEMDEAPESSATTSFVYETGAIFIENLPPARLAVRRFTGFCTAGEVARQKAALLAALELDDVELDVPHGGTVPHVVFQYNPPYALPVVRRNEIAVAVVDKSKVVEAESRRREQRQAQAAAAAAATSKQIPTDKGSASSSGTADAPAGTSIDADAEASHVAKINGSDGVLNDKEVP